MLRLNRKARFKMLKNFLRSFFKTLHSQRKIVLLVITVVVITVLVHTLISVWLSRFHNWNVPSVGTIYAIGVEVYDGDLVQDGNQSYVDWGTVYPGISTNRSFYIRSDSNVEITPTLELLNVTFLSSEGENVTDPLNNYMSLTWNYNNTPLTPLQEVYVTLTLSVSSDIDFINFLINNNVTSFSFNIHIYPSTSI